MLEGQMLWHLLCLLLSLHLSLILCVAPWNLYMVRGGGKWSSNICLCSPLQQDEDDQGEEHDEDALLEDEQHIRDAEAVAAEDEEAAAVQEQIRRIQAEEDEFETFNLKIIHRKNRFDIWACSHDESYRLREFVLSSSSMHFSRPVNELAV
jgi:hypothetical protein